jgi:hypothetical protein
VNYLEAVSDSGEVGSLAELMTRAMRDQVAFYQQEFGLTLEEAHANVSAPASPEEVARIRRTPPAHYSWLELNRLMRTDAEQGLAQWNNIKQAARDELQSGHRAAHAVDWAGSPWTRAQFVAIRESLTKDWHPSTGMERMLIDIAAQAFTEYLFWQTRLTELSTSQGKLTESELDRTGHWEPERVAVADAIHTAAEMVDRYHRILMRTVRNLRDLKRYGPTLTIGSVGQLNVAANQMNANVQKGE